MDPQPIFLSELITLLIFVSLPGWIVVSIFQARKLFKKHVKRTFVIISCVVTLLPNLIPLFVFLSTGIEVIHKNWGLYLGLSTAGNLPIMPAAFITIAFTGYLVTVIFAKFFGHPTIQR